MTKSKPFFVVRNNPPCSTKKKTKEVDAAAYETAHGGKENNIPDIVRVPSSIDESLVAENSGASGKIECLRRYHADRCFSAVTGIDEGVVCAFPIGYSERKLAEAKSSKQPNDRDAPRPLPRSCSFATSDNPKGIVRVVEREGLLMLECVADPNEDAASHGTRTVVATHRLEGGELTYIARDALVHLETFAHLIVDVSVPCHPSSESHPFESGEETRTCASDLRDAQAGSPSKAVDDTSSDFDIDDPTLIRVDAEQKRVVDATISIEDLFGWDVLTNARKRGYLDVKAIWHYIIDVQNNVPFLSAEGILSHRKYSFTFHQFVAFARLVDRHLYLIENAAPVVTARVLEVTHQSVKLIVQSNAACVATIGLQPIGSSPPTSLKMVQRPPPLLFWAECDVSGIDVEIVEIVALDPGTEYDAYVTGERAPSSEASTVVSLDSDVAKSRLRIVTNTRPEPDLFPSWHNMDDGEKKTELLAVIKDKIVRSRASVAGINIPDGDDELLLGESSKPNLWEAFIAWWHTSHCVRTDFCLREVQHAARDEMIRATAANDGIIVGQGDWNAKDPDKLGNWKRFCWWYYDISQLATNGDGDGMCECSEETSEDNISKPPHHARAIMTTFDFPSGGETFVGPGPNHHFFTAKTPKLTAREGKATHTVSEAQRVSGAQFAEPFLFLTGSRSTVQVSLSLDLSQDGGPMNADRFFHSDPDMDAALTNATTNESTTDTSTCRKELDIGECLEQTRSSTWDVPVEEEVETIGGGADRIVLGSIASNDSLGNRTEVLAMDLEHLGHNLEQEGGSRVEVPLGSEDVDTVEDKHDRSDIVRRGMRRQFLGRKSAKIDRAVSKVDGMMQFANDAKKLKGVALFRAKARLIAITKKLKFLKQRLKQNQPATTAADMVNLDLFEDFDENDFEAVDVRPTVDMAAPQRTQVVLKPAPQPMLKVKDDEGAKKLLLDKSRNAYQRSLLRKAFAAYCLFHQMKKTEVEIRKRLDVAQRACDTRLARKIFAAMKHLAELTRRRRAVEVEPEEPSVADAPCAEEEPLAPPLHPGVQPQKSFEFEEHFEVEARLLSLEDERSALFRLRSNELRRVKEASYPLGNSSSSVFFCPIDLQKTMPSLYNLRFRSGSGLELSMYEYQADYARFFERPMQTEAVQSSNSRGMEISHTPSSKLLSDDVSNASLVGPSASDISGEDLSRCKTTEASVERVVEKQRRDDAKANVMKPPKPTTNRPSNQFCRSRVLPFTNWYESIQEQQLMSEAEALCRSHAETENEAEKEEVLCMIREDDLSRSWWERGERVRRQHEERSLILKDIKNVKIEYAVNDDSLAIVRLLKEKARKRSRKFHFFMRCNSHIDMFLQTGLGYYNIMGSNRRLMMLMFRYIGKAQVEREDTSGFATHACINIPLRRQYWNAVAFDLSGIHDNCKKKVVPDEMMVKNSTVSKAQTRRERVCNFLDDLPFARKHMEETSVLGISLQQA